MLNFRRLLGLIVLLTLLPGLAFAQVDDRAGLFSPSTVTQLNQRCDDLSRRYGKNVLIMTVTSIGNQRIEQAARASGPRDLNGVFVFIARTENKLGIFSSRSMGTLFTSARKDQVRDAIIDGFRRKDFDGGITAGMAQIESIYASAPTTAPARRGSASASPSTREGGGGGGGWFFWLVVLGGLYFGYKLLRSMAGPGTSGYGGGSFPPSGGYNGGYGAGMGGGYGAPAPPSGGGGSFLRSFLGGAAGAAAGSYLYDKMTDHHYDSGHIYAQHDSDWSDSSASYDAGGSSMDYDSGSTGSWDDGGGGGDWGGGGDSGGGGGDW